MGKKSLSIKPMLCEKKIKEGKVKGNIYHKYLKSRRVIRIFFYG